MSGFTVAIATPAALFEYMMFGSTASDATSATAPDCDMLDGFTARDTAMAAALAATFVPPHTPASEMTVIPPDCHTLLQMRKC